jgi:Flp pilus assembly pilin Flp
MPWKPLEKFAADESGAVTVDWVVLTAAIVAMVLSVFTIITRDSVSVGANLINDTMVEASEFARDPGAGEVGNGDPNE